MAGELAYSLKEVWRGLVILVTRLISGMKRVEMCEVRDDSGLLSQVFCGVGVAASYLPRASKIYLTSGERYLSAVV